MTLRLLLVLGLGLGLTVSVVSCGVKNDLIMPNGKDTPKNQKDPSKPPQPL